MSQKVWNPPSINNQTDVEAELVGTTNLQGGSKMYKYKVKIITMKKTTTVYVHYKPDVAKGKWRWGPDDGNMRDFANASVQNACSNAKKSSSKGSSKSSKS